MKKYFLMFTAFFLMNSHTANAQNPNGEFIEVTGAKAAVILVHGRGQGPNGQVVGPLRHALAKEAMMHTLSLQMPVLATTDYLAYAATFPSAYNTLQLAVSYLVQFKGVQRIYLLGYSMGARMSLAYLATQQTTNVVGYIGIGVLDGGGDLLDANLNIAKLKIPVLDLYATVTPLDLKSAKQRESLVGKNYQQTPFLGANHQFSGYDSALMSAASNWLQAQER